MWRMNLTFITIDSKKFKDLSELHSFALFNIACSIYLICRSSIKVRANVWYNFAKMFYKPCPLSWGTGIFYMALGSTRFLTLITLYTNNHHGLRESCFGFCEIPDDPHYGCTGSNFRDVKPTEALTPTGGTDDSAVLLPTTVEHCDQIGCAPLSMWRSELL